MAVTLTQQEYLSQDLLRKGVISTFAENSAVLKYLPVMTINSNSYVYNREAVLPGSSFRDVGSDYTENAGTVSQNTETLKIMGGSVDIDRYLTLTQNVNDIKAIQIAMLAKSVALDFDKAFFNGDAGSTDTEFDGLKNRLSDAQVIDGGGDALTLTEMDELIDTVRGGPDVIFCDKAVIRKVNNLMRAEGQALEWIDGSFGRKIPMYAGIPLVVPEMDSSGDPILNDNTSSPAYELYGVKFGVDKCLGLQAEPMRIVDFGLYSGSSQQRVMIEWIVSFITATTDCAARLHSVTV
jgi:hypothetical protein